jgi:uncharacterized membrane protein
MSWQSIASAVVVALSVVVGNAQGAVQYSVTDVGTLGGGCSRASDINASGQVVGDSINGAGKYSFSGV